ncbi:CDP-alcohol phosphatidyltransferase family protein [Gammaproteobacteria bacterium]|nr:CDP-alcohol phosphatidyltransferase family protein [Gammaproteobacteria bacterium]
MNFFIQSLTYFRILIAPVIFLLIISDFYGWALILTILAGSSDFWDGYLARRYNLESTLGGVLDPIADKILLTFLILSLTLDMSSQYIGFTGGIILVREFWVAALRDINARGNNEDATKVTFFAKIKTSMQLITFIVLLSGLHLNNSLIILIGNFILFASLIVTLQTGLEYTVSTFKNLNAKS